MLGDRFTLEYSPQFVETTVVSDVTALSSFCVMLAQNKKGIEEERSVHG